MHHPIKVILILQLGLVKADQQEIVKVTWPFLKFWNDGNLQLSFAGELVTKQRLTRAVVVVFFGHMEPPVYSKEQVLLHTGSQTTKVAHFCAIT